MDILLVKDVQNLGEAGTIVTVKAGYAVNYLIPQGFAKVATASVKKQFEENARQRAHKEAKLLADAEAQAALIAAQKPVVTAKVTEEGRLYGSVTADQLAAALEAKGITVDKKDITILSDEVKALGTYEASVKLHKAVKANFSFEVVAE